MSTFKLLIAAAVVMGVTGAVVAGHGDCDCPSCGCKICVFEPETVKVKKHCWEVECKDICIPKFKWPWESCCEPPACGKVRTVKVLKKKEYECEKCGYKWHVQTVCDEPCGPCGAASPCQGQAPMAPPMAPPAAGPTASVSPVPRRSLSESTARTAPPPVTFVENGQLRTAGAGR